MDPADPDSIIKAIAAHGQTLGRHDEGIKEPLSYATDRSRIAYMVGLLSGKASEWATAAWNCNSDFCKSYPEFTAEMRRIFDHPIQCKEAGQRLFSLRQGTSSVAQYSLNFRIAAAESGWDETALQGAFFHGLNENMKDELAARDECSDLESLISLAVRLDNRLRERRREKASSTRYTFYATPPAPLKSEQESTKPNLHPVQRNLCNWDAYAWIQLNDSAASCPVSASTVGGLIIFEVSATSGQKTWLVSD
ncbi:hypothetical protein WMY93_003875 [Mugilogobius chulae]|uniref:Retrotransposon gag domain-containing protein n=1 Tax=Mugilogobius chulae TaxID=88201 RepID=A0AAW0Q0T3_9GOBI